MIILIVKDSQSDWRQPGGHLTIKNQIINR